MGRRPLWRIGPVTIADHTRDANIADIARRILADAPRHFHLVGLSMGGYIAFEVLRQAADRVGKLALLDTSARADVPEQTKGRYALIELARTKGLRAVNNFLFPLIVHESRNDDRGLRSIVDSMAEDAGVEAFVRQQTAIMHRPDSRPDLPSFRCPTLVVVGDSDQITPPNLAREIAEGVSGAQLEIIGKYGHLSTLEAPDAVNRVLVPWLAP